jgi:hypothetical protein
MASLPSVSEMNPDPEWFDRPLGMLKPDYLGACLSNITPTIASLLGAKTDRPTLPKTVFGDTEMDAVDKVVLFLFDGFRYDDWRRRKDGFVGFMNNAGNLAPITTVFPSTTAAALTSIATSLTPQEHCLPEWFVYLKEADMVVESLPFSGVTERGRDSLLRRLNPHVLFRGQTVFSALRKQGIDSASFLPRAIASSVYTKVSQRGSVVLPYLSASDLSLALRRQLELPDGPRFIYVYWSSIDTIEHVFGATSQEASVEIDSVSFALKQGLLARADTRASGRTLLLATADHGQIDVSPRKTRYLNRIKSLSDSYEISPGGRPILPSGGARDVFLHIKPERLEKIEEELSKRLAGFASIVRTETAIRAGLFGINRPRKRFVERVGNLLILPHRKETLWYEFKDRGRFDLKGHHGGLTHDELIVPLASARLDSPKALA